MASNTKLTPDTKTDLKMELAEFAKEVYSFEFSYNEISGITVLTVRPFKGSNVIHIATAIRSPDEKKFRKSVGRYFAFNKYINGNYIDAPAHIGLGVFDEL